MSISIERYVQITSGVIGAQAVAERELIGLRFTTDPRVPVDAMVVVDRDGAIDYFGASAPETVFANQYFAYISPAPASQAQRLRFAAWPKTARAARIYGAEINTQLTALQAISDGALNLTLGATTHELTGINLGTAASFADVAAALQTAIQAYVAGGANWTAATVTYDAVAGAFNLLGGTTGNAAIDVGDASVGTDLAPLLGWGVTGDIMSPGSVAMTPLEAFRNAEQITDSFGSTSFSNGSSINGILSVSEAVELATYVASQNVKYQLYVQVAKSDEEDYQAALINIQSVGLILNATAGEWKEALPAAIMAATNYSRQNATVNYMYRQGPFTADVTTDAEADVLDEHRVNYYGETASAGQKLAFFQRGYLMGGATAPLDMNVHANEQWLKAFLTARLLSLQLSLGRIPANNEGRGYIRGQIMEGVNRAKLNGTILMGKELTVAQQIAVTQLTGDPDAWRDVQIQGFWLDVVIVQETGPSGVTEYIAQYTLAYSKNDVVRKVEGSHNLV
jgi:hypothetical protein